MGATVVSYGLSVMARLNLQKYFILEQYDEKEDGGESIQYTTTTKSISVWQFSCSQYTFFLTLFGVFK